LYWTEPVRGAAGEPAEAERTVVFIDEAGNTGTNFLDPQQRWYVLSAIAVRRKDLKTARSRLKAVVTASGASEAKGSALLKTPGGRKWVYELMRATGGSGCVPFFVLLEKRFNLAARFDQVVSDPKGNPRFTWQDHLDLEKRRAAAAAIARLEEATLQKIQSALLASGDANWPTVVGEVVQGLTQMGELELAHQIAGVENATARELFGAAEKLERKDMSVNEAAFTTLLQLLDQVSFGSGIRTVELIHDETASFEGTFKAVYERLRGQGAKGAIEVNGVKVWPLVSIRDLSFTASHDEPLVQSADVHAALMNWVCSSAHPRAYRNEPHVRKMGELLIGMLASTDPRLVWPLASDEDLERVVKTLGALRQK